MILIADSGSTKTDWCVTNGENVVCQLYGQGINPFQQSKETISDIVFKDVANRIPDTGEINEIYFYGAGCRDEMKPLIKDVLTKHFINAEHTEVNSDLMAAARALLGNRKGIACILGTGSNSCLYDGSEITDNTPPLGYILGDEGSGAVLGRMFVNALFKNQLADDIKKTFLDKTRLTLSDIIDKVYRQPLANRFLASLSPFIHDLSDNKAVRNIIVDNFRNFFKLNIDQYRQQGAEINAIGSIAFYYKKELAEAAEAECYKLGTVIKSPMSGLVKYHTNTETIQ